MCYCVISCNAAAMAHTSSFDTADLLTQLAAAVLRSLADKAAMLGLDQSNQTQHGVLLAVTLTVTLPQRRAGTR